MGMRGVVSGIACFVALMAAPALGQVAFVLPEPLPAPEQKKTEKKAPDEPLMIPVPALRLTLGLVDTSPLRGVDLERPQAFTVLRNRLANEVSPPAEPAPADPPAGAPAAEATPPKPAPAAPAAPEKAPPPPTITPERSEHLSTLEETTAFGAPAWVTEVAMPHAGVHHFIMETKPTWTPEKNRFVQHVVKTLQSSQANLDLWDKPAGLDFEIMPLSRPFGLCEGMSFSGQVMRNNAPLPNAEVEVVWLPDAAASRKKTTRPLAGTTQFVKADASGVFTVACPWAGWWGFSVVTTGGDPLKDPEGNMKPLDLKATLWVPMDVCNPGSPS